MGEEDYEVDRTDHFEDSFYIYKKQAIKAAKDLCYPPMVREKLEKCTTIGQLSIVMTTARKTYL